MPRRNMTPKMMRAIFSNFMRVVWVMCSLLWECVDRKGNGRTSEARVSCRPGGRRSRLPSLRLKGLDVGSRQGLAADGPLAARDFHDADPGDAAHGLALDP